MSKRMALVPEELLSSYQLRDPETRIEDEMAKLLDRNRIPDDAKVKLLSQLITRYHKIVNTPAEPISVKMQEEMPTPSVKKDEDPPVDSIIQNILTTVPRQSEKYIKPIIEKLKTRGISYNDRGEMTQDNNVIKHSNIIDFFSYLMRNSKNQLQPEQFSLFLKAIKDAKIPSSWIMNKRLYKDLQHHDDLIAATPLSDERYFSPTKRSRSRSVLDLSFQGESPAIKWRSRSQSPNQEWLTY